jgi:8-oxo-dGTP pyrophosphatase MutT (NUDIX family)
VLKRDSVLMVERASGPFAGLWSFPGGRSEPGESPEATAQRELLEETGLKAGPLVPLGTFAPVPEFRLTVFAARAPEALPHAGTDARQAEYVPLSSVLTRKTTPGAVRWVARALAALAPPDFPLEK